MDSTQPADHRRAWPTAAAVGIVAPTRIRTLALLLVPAFLTVIISAHVGLSDAYLSTHIFEPPLLLPILNVISSLVALQMEGLQDAALRPIFQDVAHRVRSMAMVHEKLYQSADLAQVDFADYAQSLLTYLRRAHADKASSIHLELDLEPVPLPVHMAVPCGLILNELFSNALKHAFGDRTSGCINVALHENAHGRVRLGVRDDGKGLPPEFDWQQSTSLGLRLVAMLARQIHAALEVTSDQGAHFTLIFERHTE